MALSAPVHPNAGGFRPAGFTRRKSAALPAASAGKVVPFPSPQAQHVLVVEFTSPDGRTSRAIGGGTTLAAAIAFARDSCPTDTTWQPIAWTDLYGD